MIGENCTIGPNAYIRGGTVLCGLNKIGAATEVKNDAKSEKSEPEKPDAKLNQDKADADSKPESNDESEEVNKTKS